MSISLKRRNVAKQKTPFFCILKGLSNKHELVFMGTLTGIKR